MYRLSIFEQNVNLIEDHNSMRYKMWVMEVNKFADMTLEEFESERGFIAALDPTFYRREYQILAQTSNVTDLNYEEAKKYTYPDYVDWRRELKVGRVRD